MDDIIASKIFIKIRRREKECIKRETTQKWRGAEEKAK